MTIKKAVFLLFLIMLIGSAYAMNFSSVGQPTLKQFGNGAGMLDMKFFYTAKQGIQNISSLGETGNIFYKRLLYIDFIFIASFAYIKIKTMLWFIHYFNLPARYSKWSALALIRGAFDIAENILILIALKQKNISANLMAVAGVITSLKWLSMILFFSLLTFIIEKGMVKINDYM